jgi:hypothetical protein
MAPNYSSRDTNLTKVSDDKTLMFEPLAQIRLPDCYGPWVTTIHTPGTYGIALGPR